MAVRIISPPPAPVGGRHTCVAGRAAVFITASVAIDVGGLTSHPGVGRTQTLPGPEQCVLAASVEMLRARPTSSTDIP